MVGVLLPSDSAKSGQDFIHRFRISAGAFPQESFSGIERMIG